MSDVSIRVLEQWHRVWEIENPDKLVENTFASDADMAHEHAWREFTSHRSGVLLKRCTLCPVIKRA